MKGKRRRNPRGVIYLILAILVFLLPVVLTQYKNWEQHQIAEEYSRSVFDLTPEKREQAFAEAQDYNAHLPEVGAPDPWVNGVDTKSPDYQHYLQVLRQVGPMARVRVPSVGIDLPVYHGTSTDVLAHGVGHLYGTALPVGGEGNHAVLTGHTGLATLTMFDNLTHIKKGDVFTVEVMGKTMAYKVDQIETVLPDQVESLRAEEGRDLVTLVTCTPYGINSHRLLVRGERTELPAELDQSYHSLWQPWMIAAIIIVLFVLLYLLWWFLAGRKRKKKEEELEES
ncbi:TPA: class C sortase [Corynebacterium striatum]|nr:class C sortase [Corynebacterium striatum]